MSMAFGQMVVYVALLVPTCGCVTFGVGVNLHSTHPVS